MHKKKEDLPKIFPFITESDPKPAPHEDHPAPAPASNPHKKVSESGLLSAVMSLLSLSALSVAMLGGGRLIIDIFAGGIVAGLQHIWAKAVVLGLAYLFGWVTGILAIRVYDNRILPIIIRIYTWGDIAAICFLYIMIIQRLFRQSYDIEHYWAYYLTMAAGLGALVGLHFIIEGLDLRLYSIPLLVVCLVQVAAIVIRYVFTNNPKSEYLLADLLFLGGMVIFSSLMLAHLGLLSPFRNRLKHFFDQNSVVIRPEN
jgi:hypothetical protein